MMESTRMRKVSSNELFSKINCASGLLESNAFNVFVAS